MPLPTQKSQQSALKIIPNTPGIMNSHLCDYLLWTHLLENDSDCFLKNIVTWEHHIQNQIKL